VETSTRLFAPHLISEREQSVLEFASFGLKDQEICEQLGIATGTLGTYWSRIKNKTGLTSRTRLSAEYSAEKYRRSLCRCLKIISIDWLKSSSKVSEHLIDQIPIPIFLLRDCNEIFYCNSTGKVLMGGDQTQFDDHFEGWKIDDTQELLNEEIVSLFDISTRRGLHPGSFQALCLALDENKTNVMVALMPREPAIRALVDIG
jgi:DNA-binding CsgD family transcriptional regulator